MTLLKFARDKRGGVLRAAFLLLLFLAAAGTLGWMLMLPAAICAQVEGRTGFAVAADSLACNPFGVTLDASEVAVENPSAFGGGQDMLEVRSIKAKASLPALARGDLWIDQLDLDIARATLVLDERGQLNLDSFLQLLLTGQAGDGTMAFHVVNGRVRIDEIHVVDYSRSVPVRQTYRPMLDVTVKDAERPIELFAAVLEIPRRAGNFRLP